MALDAFPSGPLAPAAKRGLEKTFLSSGGTQPARTRRSSYRRSSGFNIPARSPSARAPGLTRPATNESSSIAKEHRRIRRVFSLSERKARLPSSSDGRLPTSGKIRTVLVGCHGSLKAMATTRRYSKLCCSTARARCKINAPGFNRFDPSDEKSSRSRSRPTSESSKTRNFRQRPSWTRPSTVNILMYTCRVKGLVERFFGPFSTALRFAEKAWSVEEIAGSCRKMLAPKRHRIARVYAGCDPTAIPTT